MTENARSVQDNNIILLRGAALWILVALVLAWCLVSLKMEAPLMSAIFPGKFSRVLQAHIDFLLMSALLLGFYGTRSSFRLARALGNGRGRIHQFEPVHLAGGVSNPRRPAGGRLGSELFGSISRRAS